MNNGMNNGIYIPPRFQKNVIPMFHLDNIDWLEDTPDGKKTSHLLQLCAFQPKRCQNLLPIVMDLNVTDKLTLVSNNFGELLDCSKPQKTDIRRLPDEVEFRPHSIEQIKSPTMSIEHACY